MNRSLLVAVALIGLLVAVAASGAAHVRALHVAREARATAALQNRIDSYGEHARFLARQPPERMPAFLSDFRGLSRVRIADAAGAVRHQYERFGYLVAATPSERRPAQLEDEPDAVSGLETDRSREDLRPDLRRVFRHTVSRPDGGALELTVYAEPVAHERIVTAAGEPMLDSGVRLREGRWHVALPSTVSLEEVAPYVAIGVGVLTLGFFALVMIERQRAERRLAQGQRLRALGLLASGIAHEINNPLEGIANWLAVGDTSKAQAGLDRIARLTGDLLRFARGEGATSDDEPAPVAACFRAAADLARLSSGCRTMVIEEELPDDLDVRVPTAVLEQIFLNLLLNAGAATAGRVRVAHRADKAVATIDLIDDGPGIPDGDLARIFDPFFSRSGGTGLGLSVSYGMAEAAGGRLTVRNAIDGGAHFRLELPRS